MAKKIVYKFADIGDRAIYIVQGHNTTSHGEEDHYRGRSKVDGGLRDSDGMVPGIDDQLFN